MGRIANKYCNKIYLTDDNPRKENPKKIRDQIKKGISRKKLIEISSRKIAINTAIKNIQSNEIVIVAGKGHESYQEYKSRKYFSDKDCILKSIKEKNKNLNNSWKTNIIEEKIEKKLSNNIKINEACINSKEIKKNNIFFGIKGKKTDGNKFANEALKQGASISIVDKNYGPKVKNKIQNSNQKKAINKGSTNPTLLNRTVTGFSFLGILNNIGALIIGLIIIAIGIIIRSYDDVPLTMVDAKVSSVTWEGNDGCESEVVTRDKGRKEINWKCDVVAT